jgi:predicted nucleic acid-binding protein
VTIISNTSPIVNLATIGQLNLLRQLYESIIIPQAVHHEITIVGGGLPGAQEIQTQDWIVSKHVSNRLMVSALRTELDEGKAEAIALAIELGADLLLLDERLGRTIASRFGLQFIGILGVLIEAKDKGLIPEVKPVVDDLMTKAGFWVSQELYERILRVAGE